MLTKEQMREMDLKGSKFIKVKIGESYDGIFIDMNFDAKGGFGGGPTIRYLLQDLKDGKTREFSSVSNTIRDVASRLQKGDKVRVSASLNDKEKKQYNMVVLEQGGVAVPTTPSPTTPVMTPGELPTITIDEEDVKPGDLPF